MLLIPQLFFRNGKIAIPESSKNSIINEDPMETTRLLKDAGVEAIYCIDLSITPIGESPNFLTIKKIREAHKLSTYLGGNFKTLKEIEGYIRGGVELVALGSIAYQRPDFLKEACEKLPARIAAKIDVRGDKVTIPGYAVASNKSPIEYADYFNKNGVRYIMYSDAQSDGSLTEKNIANIETFCREVTARIICTTEVQSLADVEKIASIDHPRLEGLVISKAIYNGKIDIRGAVALVNDITLTSGSESTLTEM